MDLWTWEEVVNALEHAEEDGCELKHFSSVFWQYRIEGKELAAMDQCTIELLVESWSVTALRIVVHSKCDRVTDRQVPQQHRGRDV